MHSRKWSNSWNCVVTSSWVEAYFTFRYRQSSADLLNVTLIKHCLLISLSWYIVISSQLRTVLNRRACDKTCTFSRISYVINLRQQSVGGTYWRPTADTRKSRLTMPLKCELAVSSFETLEELFEVSSERFNSRMQSDGEGFLHDTQALLCLQFFFHLTQDSSSRQAALSLYITEQSMLTCVLMSDTASLFMNIRSNRLWTVRNNYQIW